MKRSLVLSLGFLVISAGLIFAGGPKAPSAAFTLAASGNAPVPMAFTLAPVTAEPGSLGVLGGSGYVEDSGAPFNTAIGWQALANSTLNGDCNAASGYQALYANTTGRNNTASGYQALFHNESGEANAAFGMGALYYNTIGGFNVAIGEIALEANTSGYGNTAIGSTSLRSNTTGSYNTAAGMEAGENTGSGSFNIHIGAKQTGYMNESNTIRIGIPYDPLRPTLAGQNRCFVAGIVENAFTTGTAANVVGITGDGQLGTIPPEMLPTKGDPGPQGPQGPAGEGLVSGSCLFLPPGVAAPSGYTYLGSTFFPLTGPDKKTVKFTIHVYRKD